jgi:hypothetical protein
LKALIAMTLLVGPPTWVMATRDCKPCDMKSLEDTAIPPDTRNCGRARNPDAGTEQLMAKCFTWAQKLGPVKMRFDNVGEDEPVDFTYVGFPDGGIEIFSESHSDVCEGGVSQGSCVELPAHPGSALGCKNSQFSVVCSESSTTKWTLSKPKPMKELLTAGVLYLPPDAGNVVCEQHLRGLYCIAANEWHPDAGR